MTFHFLSLFVEVNTEGKINKRVCCNIEVLNNIFEYPTPLTELSLSILNFILLIFHLTKQHNAIKQDLHTVLQRPNSEGLMAG